MYVGYFSIADRAGRCCSACSATPAGGKLHAVPPAGVASSRPRCLRWVPGEYGGSLLLYAILFNLSRLSFSVRGKVGCLFLEVMLPNGSQMDEFEYFVHLCGYFSVAGRPG